MTKRSPTALAKKALKALVFGKFPWMLGHSCGKPALYMKFIPVEGDCPEPTDAIYPDGTHPKPDEDALCYSCKQPLTHADLGIENFVRLQ